MKHSLAKPTGPAKQLGGGGSGHVRSKVLPLVFLVAVIGVSAYWFSRNANRAEVKPVAEAGPRLSDATKAVLNRLQPPVAIRFYSILDPASVSPAYFPFVERVKGLLAEFQRQGNGKVDLVVYGSISNSVAESAAADGIKPFNLDKGDACYLAITVAGADKRETLVELAPEWEPALEFDLSRAIERVSRPNPPPKPSAEAARTGAEATEQVMRAIPNLASVSVEEGTQILQSASMKEFKAAIDDMASQISAAQQQFTQAQQGGSEADQQAARKRLQQLQAEQAEKIKQIAARLDAQLNALKQLKAK